VAQESVGALLEEIRTAVQVMGPKNRYRMLLLKCAAAVEHLARQLHAAKGPSRWERVVRWITRSAGR
jgi:hypothetical protein